jgi:hypothetical protein
VQTNNDQFPFLAPTDGYLPEDKISMPVVPDVNWKQDVQRSYYFHTAAGNFGSMNFRMIAHGDHFCLIDSFLNPSGSQNLEPQ